MRICQVMLARGFGGAERYFVDLSRELSGRGHEVLAVCHPGGMAAAALEGGKGPALAPLVNWGPWDPFAPRRLRRMLEAFNPDVVHAHLARGTAIAGRALDGMPVPLVTKTHNYVDLKYYRNVDLFVATTRDQRNYLVDQGIAVDRVRVIPNFSSLTPVPADARCGAAVVAMGRFVEKKGFRELLRAYALLRDRGMALPALVIGGEGALGGELRECARTLALGNLVQFPGWQQDAGPFLDRGKLFVLPSLDEPFGIAVIEAMARGLPIVATRTQGPCEVLDEDTAWLVTPGDSEALADAIADALQRPEEASRRAHAASERFRSTYAADVVVPRLLECYVEARLLARQ